jgi:uncharacterized protein YbjT (DUF2867 family)
VIAVTGASGKTGLAVVRAGAKRALDIRGLTHRHDRFDELTAAGATEVAIGDLDSRDSLARGLEGCSAIYHVCPNMRREELEIGERVIDACRRVGIERFVYHSVLHPQIEAMPHHWSKLRVEERLIESGVSFTVLQPAAYMQNLKVGWERILEEGVYEVPYAATTRLGMVDLEDVAAAAARVLAEPGHDGSIYELGGPQVMDQDETAAVLAERTGRDVVAQVIDRDRWARRARDAGLTPYAVGSLLAMFEHYERHGLQGNPRVLESLIERPATRLSEVVDRWIAKDRSRAG